MHGFEGAERGIVDEDIERPESLEDVFEEGLVRVAFTSGSGGPVAWRVTFSERPKTAAAVPR